MTNTMDRVKMTIGDLIIQLAAAQARIEELEQQLRDKGNDTPSDPS